VAQVAVRCPFGKLDLGDECRLEPVAVFHLFAGERLLRASLLRRIGKRARGGFELFHLRHELAADMGHEAGADLARKEQVLPW
jgi:hypothetical protein